MLQRPLTRVKKIAILLGCSLLIEATSQAEIMDLKPFIYQPKRTEFSQVVIFGDSLSDAGSKIGYRYVAGGSYYPGYFDVLNKYFSGKNRAISSTHGGTDYAEGGASTYSTLDQVKKYLKQNNNHVSKHQLHILWSGGTDANYAVVLNFYKIPFYDTSLRDFNLYDHKMPTPASAIAQSIKLLLDAGAPYVVVPNICNAGYAPITSLFHVDTTLVLIDNYLLPANLHDAFNLTVRRWYGSYLDDILRKNLSGPGEGLALLKERGVSALQTQFPFIPNPILQLIHDRLVEVETSLADQFNYSLAKALKPYDGQVVYIDASNLLKELIEHANRWKRGNINLASCSLGYSAGLCNKKDRNYYDDQDYIFGDWFHPSWETHIVLAQYIIAVLNAPDQVSSIVKHLGDLNKTAYGYLGNYLNNGPELTQDKLHQWSLFGGYSTSYDHPHSYVGGAKNSLAHYLHIGSDYYASPTTHLGALLSLSVGHEKPYQTFNYHQNSQNILFYGQWVNPNPQYPYWLRASVGFGHLNANHIQRMIRLGELFRVETGANTKAQLYSADLYGGWHFAKVIKDQLWHLSPFAGIEVRHYQFGGFTEKNNYSVSMNFDKAHYNEAFATIGLRLANPQWAVANKKISVHSQISYHQRLNSEPLSLRSKVKSSPVSFNKDIEWSNVKRFVTAETSLATSLSSKWRASASAGFKVSEEKSIQFHIGVNFSVPID